MVVSLHDFEREWVVRWLYVSLGYVSILPFTPVMLTSFSFTVAPHRTREQAEYPPAGPVERTGCIRSKNVKPEGLAEFEAEVQRGFS